MDKHWQTFTGEYEKRRYDVQLKNGQTVLNCWPNAGTFHPLMKGNKGHIEGKDVAYLRPTVKGWED